MRKIVCSLLFLGLLSVGCRKTCAYDDQNIVAPASEQQALEAYLTSNSINATKHSSGMYYQVITPGTGGSPGLCSQVLVAYTGWLTNGSQFDTHTGAAFTLGGLIVGWQKGIPLVQRGGKVKLFIPPSLGYGNVDVKNGNTVVIPANSILVFDITLTDFN
jgi:FKBP-type peptidyl-prolyl cis-trans isomerase FkpA